VITALDTSTRFVVGVVNDTAVDPPADQMTGWQFRIHVVPDATAIGTLNFGVGAEPANYVFPPGSHPFGPTSSALPGDPTTFTALDLVVPTNVGIQVPTAPGANLLSITLAPSVDALGMFGIFALNAGQDSTEWIDAASDPDNHARDFVNVPRGGAPVRIGNVRVTSVADYNLDGAVDAADYVVWRTTDGMPGGYDTWRGNFGRTAGSASGVIVNAAVPEPGSFVVLVIGILAACICRLRAAMS